MKHYDDLQDALRQLHPFTEMNFERIKSSDPIILSRTESVGRETTHQSLGTLPLEILQQTTVHLQARDIGHLRLASKACSRLGVREMLRTLPFSLTFDGIARLMAISEVGAFSTSVRRLSFSTFWDAETKPPSKSEVKALKMKHQLKLEQLASKYATGELIEKYGSTCLPWSTKPLYYEENVFGRDRRPERDGDSNPEWYKWTDRAMLAHTLGICLERFHNLEAICIDEDCYVYEWAISGQLKIMEGKFPPSSSPNISRVVKTLLVDLPGLCRQNIECLDIGINVGMNDIGIALNALEDVVGNVKKRKNTIKRMHARFSADLGWNIRGPGHRVYRTLRMLLFFYVEDQASLQEVEIKFPYRGSMDWDTNFREDKGLYSLDFPLTGIKHPHVTKLDLGNFSTTEVKLTAMLKEHHSTLRFLKLTRVDFLEGNMIRWFNLIGPRLEHLQEANFCDSFWEAWTNRAVDMDTPLELEGGYTFEDQIRPHGWLKSREKPRTVGFRLGEMCLAREQARSSLNMATLDLLESFMVRKKGWSLRKDVRRSERDAVDARW